MENVIYLIGDDTSILKITKDEKGIHVLCGAQTLGWGEPGKTTLSETLKDQRFQIERKLNRLDKTNQASKKGLKYLLKELDKENQLTLKL